ncbi:MAG TPA: sulfatase-like hydrolase/transferase, partial [Roseimicrobium sp.]|nr:sulfatase-like hydrolase/transferase [Roseimicrobium sp.]
QNRAKPFFLYLPHYATHTPIRAKPEVAAKYNGNGQAGQQTNSIYAAMVEGVDDSVGRILKKLDELNLAENTLIIFTADNGGLSVIEGPNTPATINAPLREGKGYLYEGGDRVPFIVHWPGSVKPGQINSIPISSIDLFPTLMEICGVKSNVVPDGVSLTRLFRGESIQPRALYWHYPHYSNQGGKPGAAIREGDFKLIEFYETGRWELFNVKSDFRENRNLMEEQPEVAKKMGAKLDAWRRAVGAQMMLPNPDYIPNPQDASGVVTLPAKTADVQGLQLRYEPLAHKNTLGYWVRAEDSASWEFQVSKPGKFTVEILQGCGTGQGGSEVAFTVAGQTVKTVVEDTGHFQNFKARDIGTVTIDAPGRYSLSVSCLKKAKAAVMDLRQVTLKPVL